jgi:hypothetical protein
MREQHKILCYEYKNAISLEETNVGYATITNGLATFDNKFPLHGYNVYSTTHMHGCNWDKWSQHYLLKCSKLLGESIWEDISIFSQTRCKIIYSAIYWEKKT